MVQPNKVDFDVRKLLKRKKVSRDCMTYSEHGECCIRRCKSSSDAPFSSEDDIVIENFKDSATLLRRLTRPPIATQQHVQPAW